VQSGDFWGVFLEVPFSISMIILSIIYFIFKIELTQFYKNLRKIVIDYFINIFNHKNKIIHQINSLFPEKFYTIGLKRKIPEIIIEGEYKSPILINNLENGKNHYSNELQAIISERNCKKINWNDDPLKIFSEKIRFSNAMLLRKHHKSPMIITGNVLIINPDSKKLILQARSEKSATYPNSLHIFGGALLPKDKRNNIHDNNFIKSTVLRELNEEINLTPNIDNSLIVISKELDTGYFQINFLGATISNQDHNYAYANWEGEQEIILFNELEDKLEENNFVPAAKALILIWLAFGAPGINKNKEFTSRKAKQIYKNYMKKHLKNIKIKNKICN
jgi:8-oxo-dGTP pyrophosphatase MutT (NUDIX family)